jgi:hypothetical protein
MNKLGSIAAVVGLLMLLGSFGMDTAPDGTHNIGLLQQQLMVFQLGGVLAILGAVLAAVGAAIHRMEQAGILPPADIKNPLGNPEGRG